MFKISVPSNILTSTLGEWNCVPVSRHWIIPDVLPRGICPPHDRDRGQTWFSLFKEISQIYVSRLTWYIHVDSKTDYSYFSWIICLAWYLYCPNLANLCYSQRYFPFPRWCLWMHRHPLQKISLTKGSNTLHHHNLNCKTVCQNLNCGCANDCSSIHVL